MLRQNDTGVSYALLKRSSESRGVLLYSLVGGVPLGSRKSYPLLDQFLQIL